MRKILVALVALAACGQGTNVEPEASPTVVTSTTTTVADVEEAFADVYSEALARCVAVARHRLQTDGTVMDVDVCTADLVVELTSPGG